jgi:UDP-N-acetylmuramate dehydrogenase
MSLTPRAQVPLAPLTTLGVGGEARYLVDGIDDATIALALGWAKRRGVPCRILGGGSNVVVPDEGFDGLVLCMRTRGATWTTDGSHVVVEARAGEPWDDLVAESVRRNCQGLECLSGIPGLVGATPIQNVGAYGQEVAETIREVRVLDRESLGVTSLPAARLGFAYRDSVFKSSEPERYVVLGVTFRLNSGAAPAVRYAELEKRLAEVAPAAQAYSLAEVRKTVLELRAKKSMVLDPADENGRSCGSFFVNPVVSRELANALEQKLATPGMPRYPQPDGRVKLAAGWLIERAGFTKGTRRGPVGLSTKHALAIVCHEGATATRVAAFADEIRAGVKARFGVELTPEPVFFGHGA